MIGDYMAIKKVKFNDSFIYINDEVKEEEKGYAIFNETEEDLEKTREIEPINEKDMFEDTLTDIFGDEDEK